MSGSGDQNVPADAAELEAEVQRLVDPPTAERTVVLLRVACKALHDQAGRLNLVEHIIAVVEEMVADVANAKASIDMHHERLRLLEALRVRITGGTGALGPLDATSLLGRLEYDVGELEKALKPLADQGAESRGKAAGAEQTSRQYRLLFAAMIAVAGGLGGALPKLLGLLGGP